MKRAKSFWTIRGFHQFMNAFSGNTADDNFRKIDWYDDAMMLDLVPSGQDIILRRAALLESFAGNIVSDRSGLDDYDLGSSYIYPHFMPPAAFKKSLAGREGFEPSVAFPLRRFSRPLP